MAPPYGYITSYSPRLRQYGNALLVPIIPQTQTAPAPRTTKRGTVAVNYAENEFDDDDFDDSDAPRRPTGLRSLRREELNPDRNPAGEKLGTEIFAPVNVQPILRHWMGKKPFKPGRAKQIRSQAQLPLTLVPIRIDLEVPAHQPGEPFPLPRNYLELGINPVLPAYRKPEPAPPYRVKDAFLWNLHEALATPEEFATIFVRDLDLPNPQATVMTVTNQIRQQLEEYAGVALHPLFLGAQGNVLTNNGTRVTSRDASATPATPVATNAATPSSLPDGMSAKGTVQVTAEPFPPNDSELNTDDAYRCIVNLNINLQNRLYTDKFEWSLLYTHGLAEEFSKITCADIGLGSEWVNSIAHGIYEAVLKLKKETCESGGLISGMGGYGNEIDNQAIEGHEAGWRYDPEGLGDEWEPKIEALSKEEIEKREGDRERQIRRLRRETARFSSTTGMAPDLTRQSSSGYFDVPDSDTPMGRGERNKKKRRFRSLSPGGRSGTPGARATPDTGAGAGYGGGGGTLNEWERQTWRCANCSVWGTAVWAVRDGPAGPRTLCHNCGLLYERDKQVPSWSRGLHRMDVPIGR